MTQSTSLVSVLTIEIAWRKKITSSFLLEKFYGVSEIINNILLVIFWFILKKNTKRIEKIKLMY